MVEKAKDFTDFRIPQKRVYANIFPRRVQKKQSLEKMNVIDGQSEDFMSNPDIKRYLKVVISNMYVQNRQI